MLPMMHPNESEIEVVLSREPATEHPDRELLDAICHYLRKEGLRETATHLQAVLDNKPTIT